MGEMAEDRDARVADAVESLLRFPLPEQQELLSAISGPFLEEGIWPVFDYVEAILEERKLDATTIINTFPSWHTRYSAVWPGPWTHHTSDDQIALTVVGLSFCGASSEQARRLTDAYFGALRYLARRFRQVPADPSARRHLAVTNKEISEALLKDGTISPEEATLCLKQLMAFVQHEPVGWRSGMSQPDATEWTVDLGRGIRDYADVRTIEDYLRILADPLFAWSRPTSPAHPSSLSLPEAIDYLDTVWRLKFGDRLFRLPGAARTASLALASATSEEFEARLSALADLLNRIEVPKGATRGDRGSLTELEEFLNERLPEESRRGMQEAVNALRGINALRRGRQHYGAHRDGLRAWRSLGLTHLLGEWETAWEQVQVRAAEAFNSIRQEIEALEER